MPKKRFEKGDLPGLARPRKRNINDVAKRYHYLIVCEGAKTEPQYFEAMKRKLPKAVAEVVTIDIEGVGMNTRSLVEYALEQFRAKQKTAVYSVDSLWVIFDKDSFPAEQFNQAIALCGREKGVHAVWSNQAFELWYILHFHYTESDLSRETYQERLERALRERGCADFQYRKNDPDMLEKLERYGDVDVAIQNAKRLTARWGDRNDFAHQNPRTEVYRLVAELKRYSLQNITPPP